MIYQRTNLSLDDLLSLLKNEQNKDLTLDDFLFYESIVQEGLWCEFEDYPQYHYFELANGKNYVLEHITHSTTGVVFEVLDNPTEENFCEFILRDTVHEWEGDVYENLALYRLDVEPESADEDASDVMIWMTFRYNLMADFPPLDRYLTNLDFNPKLIDSDKDTLYHPHVFATYADAQNWIDTQRKSVYHLDHGEEEAPTYTIVE